MSTVPVARLAEVFVEVADTLVDEFDLMEFLQTLTTRAAELTAATATGLLLADHDGRLQFMAASDERARMLDLFQIQADEGPCRDCFRHARPVATTDLRTAHERWPLFTPRALRAGVRSVHAFPMRLRQEVIGSLGLFGADPGTMEPADVHLIQAVADVATIGLLQERAIHRGEVLTEQLQSALNSRIVIEQAKGVIAQMYGTTVDTAFEMIRTYCRRNHLRLSQVAHDIVAEPSATPDLTPPPKPPG
jgi:GAF domain-containing protein